MVTDPVLRVRHLRHLETEDGPALMTLGQARRMDFAYTIEAKGGITEAELVDPDTGDVIASAIAECNERDTYNKRLGRTIAVGRLQLSEQERLRREQNRKAIH